MKYGICPCGKWGELPLEFNENKHFLECPCGELIYLTRHNPENDGFRTERKVRFLLNSGDK